MRGGADNLYEALSEGTDYAQVHGKKVWSTYNREKNPKGYFYEFDALAIGKKWSKTMLFDINASTPLRLLNKMLSSKKVERALGAKTRDAVVAQIKSAALSGMIYDPSVGKLVRGLMKYRDFTYMAGLVTTGQLLLQMSSGVAAATVISASINPVRATKTMAKAVQAASMSLSKTGKFHKFLRSKD